jgi:dethiobiotin synthetase
MQPYFITSSGTHVGKTHVLTTLCWQLREAARPVKAFKPLISGFDAHDDSNDTALIMQSSGLTPSPLLVETISPWRFRAPLAPNMAAAEEGRAPVYVRELAEYCRAQQQGEGVLLVEGVGGVMVPLNDDETVLDWMLALRWPVIVVVGSYLGTISHTLTAMEVLTSRGLTVAALVVNESHGSEVRMEDTVATFEKFIGCDVPIVKLPRSDKPQPWRHMPSIRWVVGA